MDDRFEIAPRAPVAEHDLAEPRAIQRSVCCQISRPEALDHGGEPGAAWRHRFARQDVGVHDGHPRFAQPRATWLFPVAMPPVSARDLAASIACRFRARRTIVLRSTIAIVSGPTPPGTGVTRRQPLRPPDGRRR